MNSLRALLLLPTVLLAVPLAALADHKHDGHEFKEEYWDGNCKVKRELKKNGEYKEKRKCEGPRHDYYEQTPVYVPAPPPVVVEPGITVQGTVRIPR